MREIAKRSTLALLIALVLGSVLAIGSVHASVLLVVACAATVCAALAIVGGGRIGQSPLVWVLIALLFVTLLQLLPLPLGLLSRIAPHNAEVWSGERGLFGAASGFAPVSLDPGATWLEAVKLWTYTCVLVSAAALANKRGATLGALLLAGSALVLALVTIAHGVTDATSVFGLYTPRLGGKGFRVAPLINPNNLAGYLNLGFAAGLGLLASEEPPLPRWVTTLALMPIAGVCVLTGSRAGIGGLVLTLLLGLLLLKPARRAERDRRRSYLQLLGAAGGVMCAAIVLAATASGGRLWHMLFEDNAAKLRLAVAALPLIAQHAGLGIGRGAFESVFPGTHVAPDNSIFSHPENFLLQWAAEWGVPITVALVLAIAFAFWRGRLTAGESPLRRALLAGIVAFTAQNLFDLAFEVPGVMIAFMVALAFAFRRGDGVEGVRAATRSSRWRRPLRAACMVAAGATLISFAWRKSGETLTTDRDSVRMALPKSSRDQAEYAVFRQQLRLAMDRHPAEPYFPRLAALVEWQFKRNPLRFLNRALERGPSEGRAHYLLARILAAQGLKSQALLELRLAAEFEPALVNRLAAATLKISHDQAELVRAAPEDAAGVPMLLALAARLPRSEEPTALALIEEALRRDPSNQAARVRLIKRLCVALAEQTPYCAAAERQGCVDQARAQLQALRRNNKAEADLPLLEAQLALAVDDPAAAARLLEDACGQVSDRAACLSLRLQAVARTRDAAALTRVIRTVQAQVCPNEKGCANLLWATGETALSLGNVEQALAQFERAATEDNNATRWRRAAQQAAKAGFPGRALQSMERAAALAPRDAAIARERDAMHQSALRIIP